METLKLKPICKLHHIKLINKGVHKEAPEYRKWVCKLCDNEKQCGK